MTAAAAVRALAEQHGVVYTKTPLDVWAHHVTRLCDDEVTLDEVELLLVALERAGHITGPEAARLHASYLRETKVATTPELPLPTPGTIDPIEDPEGFARVVQEASARAVREVVAENDRLGIPSPAGEDGRVVSYLNGKRVPPPDSKNEG
jgi:hypothetical protein